MTTNERLALVLAAKLNADNHALFMRGELDFCPMLITPDEAIHRALAYMLTDVYDDPDELIADIQAVRNGER